MKCANCNGNWADCSCTMTEAGEAFQRGRAERSEQPAPLAYDPSKPCVWDLVKADMEARDRVGRARYSVPLQPFNGRDPLRDAYEEALDQVVYLRQAIYERDNWVRMPGAPTSVRELVDMAIDGRPPPTRKPGGGR